MWFFFIVDYVVVVVVVFFCNLLFRAGGWEIEGGIYRGRLHGSKRGGSLPVALL